MGAGIAELLADAGARVTLVTPFEAAAPVTANTLESGLIRVRLRERGVETKAETELAEIRPGLCLLSDPVRGEHEVDAEHVVLVTARISDETLYRELLREREAGRLPRDLAVHAIGDCVAPRMTADVVFDGHRLAREIDEPDPETPLPYLREDRDAARVALL